MIFVAWQCIFVPFFPVKAKLIFQLIHSEDVEKSAIKDRFILLGQKVVMNPQNGDRQRDKETAFVRKAKRLDTV